MTLANAHVDVSKPKVDFAAQKYNVMQHTIHTIRNCVTH